MNELQRLKIKGHRIIFRHMKKSDLTGIWDNFNQVVDEGIYLPVFVPVRSYFEKTSWYDSVKRENEVIIVAEDLNLEEPKNILGQCEISNIEWDAAKHVGNLGVIVKKGYRDLGVGTRLIDLAIKESKKLNDKKKITLSCFSNNERAIHLYEKLGFNKVGLRKKQFLIDSQYYDEVLMELWIDEYLKKNLDFN